MWGVDDEEVPVGGTAAFGWKPLKPETAGKEALGVVEDVVVGGSEVPALEPMRPKEGFAVLPIPAAGAVCPSPKRWLSLVAGSLNDVCEGRALANGLFCAATPKLGVGAAVLGFWMPNGSVGRCAVVAGFISCEKKFDLVWPASSGAEMC